MPNFLRRRWYLLIGVILLIIFILYQAKIAQTKSQKQVAYTLKKQDLKEKLSLSGAIDAEEHVTLRFQSSGMMSWVGVKEGDFVKKYQGIASLDQQELQKTMQKYLNTFVKSRLDYDSSLQDNDIRNIGGLSEDQRRDDLRALQKAQYDLNSATLDVELKNIALKYAYLYTPIEGLVVRVESPYSGVNITPSQAEFEIINPKTIYFAATADQTDVAKLRQDETGEIKLDAYPDLKLSGKVHLISFIPKGGETGTVYLVKMTFDNPNDDYRYKFGMTGDVNFVTKEEDNVLSVPSNYIKTEKGKTYVFKKTELGSVKTFINTGQEIDNNTIVTSGLNEGDVIYD